MPFPFRHALSSGSVPDRFPGRVLLGLLLVGVGTALLSLSSARAQTVSDLDPVAGVPDTTLRVYGTNLDGLTTSDVTIGGLAVSSILGTVESTLTSNLLTVQVPSSGLEGPQAVQVGDQTAARRFTVVTGGPAAFSESTTFFSDEDNASSPRAVARGDIDGDGDLDLVLGLGATGEVLWFENDGAGSFEDARTITSGLNSPRDIVLADVVDDQDASSARDGALDVVVAGGENADGDSSDDVIRVFPNQRTGPEDVSFGSQTIVQSSPVDDVRGLAAGDIDADGDVDLVSVSDDNDRLVRHRNDDSTFTSDGIETLSDPRTVALTDLDGDDRLDIVTAEHTSSGTVLRLDGNGDGTFASSELIISDLNITDPVDLDVADFSGNAAPGVVVATEGTGEAIVIRNTDSGFSQLGVAGTSGPTTTVHAADISEGDARPEVIFGNADTQEMTWHSSSGSFGGSTTMATMAGTPTDVVTADLDGDGDLDPVVLTRSSDRATLFPNGAAAPSLVSFPPDTTIDEDTQAGPLSFTVNDLDNTEEDLSVTGTSSNPALVPDANVVIGSDGPDSTLTVTPRPDSNGTATITVSVDDGTTVISDALTLTVDPVNDPPTIGPIADQTTDEDTPLTVSFSVSDLETALSTSDLSITSSNRDLVRAGDVTLSGPDSDGVASATIDPRPDSNGTATLTVTVADEEGLSASEDFGLTVAPVNDPPALETNAGLSMPSQDTVAVTESQLTAVDVDDAPGDVVFTLASAPTQGDLLVNSTALADGDTFTQQQINEDAVAYAHTGTGADSLALDLADDAGATGVTGAIFSIDIGTENVAPTLETNDGLTLDEDTEAAITTDHLLASDPDDAPADVRFTVTSGPEHGRLTGADTTLADGDAFTLQDLSDETVVYAPDANYNGADSLSFTLSDEDTTSVTAETFAITVTPVNDPPVVATNDTLRVQKGASAPIDSTRLRAGDPDDAPSALLYTIDTPPDHGRLRLNGEPLGSSFTQADVNDGLLTYAHDSSATRADAVAFTVTDQFGEGLSVSDTLDVTIEVVDLAVDRDTARAGLVSTDAADTLRLDVTNTGTVALTALQAAFVDADVPDATAAPDDFAVASGLDAPLPPGETRPVRVTLAPSAPGLRAATLRLTTAEGAEIRSTLIGRGLGLSVRAEAPARGTAATVDLTVEGGYRPGRDSLFARRGGTAPFRAVPLAVAAEGPPLELTAQVPDSLVTARGVDYYLRLSNADGTLTVPPAADRGPRHLPVRFEQLEAPFALQPEQYRMVSVPAAPTEGVKAALETAYGRYDPAVWRLERWNGRDATYRSFPRIEQLRPGRAFWLVTAGANDLALPAGQTVDADTTWQIPLRAGWNQVGTPFGFAVPWDTVRAASGLAPAAVDGPIAYRDSAYTPSDRLRPWNGYFVFSAEADTLRIPPVGPAALKTSTAPPQTTAAAPDTATSRYELRVEALGASGRAATTLALRRGARTGRDRYDRAQPPPLRTGPRLGALVSTGDRSVPHAYSARPLRTASKQGTSANGQHWTLRLHRPASDAETTEDAPPLTLRLTENGERPAGWTRYVLDLSRDTRIADGAALALDPGETRRLKVIVGTASYAEQASGDVSLSSLETGLRGSYPNPFTDRATIEYVLGEGQDVTIQIYNVLGQRVRTLVDAPKTAGVHRVEWNGQNRYGTTVGSGVYFYRLQAGDTSETRKMVLVR